MTPKSCPGSLWRLLLKALGLVVAVVLCLNFWVLWRGGRYLKSRPQDLPDGAIGLVLGTSPRLPYGRFKNPFFEGRMDAAAALFHSGKLRHLLLSGDHRSKDYDEPRAMHAALVARGVPTDRMTRDDAGLRTWDSIVRAKDVFGYKSVTIVTDDFHQARALFLAEACGLEAVGFASRSVPLRQSLKTRLREWVSRIRACVDVYL